MKRRLLQLHRLRNERRAIFRSLVLTRQGTALRSRWDRFTEIMHDRAEYHLRALFQSLKTSPPRLQDESPSRERDLVFAVDAFRANFPLVMLVFAGSLIVDEHQHPMWCDARLEPLQSLTVAAVKIVVRYAELRIRSRMIERFCLLSHRNLPTFVQSLTFGLRSRRPWAITAQRPTLVVINCHLTIPSSAFHIHSSLAEGSLCCRLLHLLDTMSRFSTNLAWRLSPVALDVLMLNLCSAIDSSVMQTVKTPPDTDCVLLIRH